MKEKELIETNAVLQESLTKENEKYYGNLLIYIRIMAFFRDVKKSEELLLEVLRDILDAQEQGLSAEEYFGENPKKVADDIIKQLPINLLDTVKIILIALASYSIFSILPKIIFPDEDLDIGSLLISGFYWTVMVIFALWLLGISLYRFKDKLSKLVLLLLVGLGVSVGFYISFVVSTSFKVNLSGNLGIVTIILISGIVLYLFYKEKDKKLWAPFLPFIVTYGILGILTRIDIFSELLSSKEGKIGVGVILGILLLLQYVFIYWFCCKVLNLLSNKVE
ncbi:hypothetical protein KQ224_08660 [Streptococcus parasuis]|uniref:hypothetical protein n=1 Tax=Streptococcus parasuis TaxID=1501662 RepID=UPI001C1F3BE2|nr:hypothetical protein KQ224_08660 [Streptococcus parasuis]